MKSLHDPTKLVKETCNVMIQTVTQCVQACRTVGEGTRYSVNTENKTTKTMRTIETSAGLGPSWEELSVIEEA